MKKGLLSSYFGGVRDKEHGESYSNILRYFLPEFITGLLLYSLLYLLDAYFIAHLKSTDMYATLGVTNTFLNIIVKMAEGISVGAIIMTGMHNGAGRLEKAGRSFVDAFWTTLLSGAVISAIIYCGAYWIYKFYGVPQEMIAMGVPFLRIRALGIFFMFVYFAFIGFLRGVKNTKTPMKIFIIGGAVFLFFDYVLIFGKLGFPQMGLSGSALATVLQYGTMVLASAISLFFHKKYRPYSIKLLSVFSSGSQLKRILQLSWPVMIDKATLAVAYFWLGAMIAPMGKFALATFSVVKDLERFAFLPAVAFAQVVTLLVSNEYGKQDWDGVKSTTKKIVFMASCFVGLFLIILSLWPQAFVQIFDKNGDFTWLAAKALPWLSVFVFFDLLQLILSGALRGASNVKTVMNTRLLVCIGYFAPISYILSILPIENQALKFVLIYGSFYVGNALMSIAYINRFRGEEWKQQAR